MSTTPPEDGRARRVPLRPALWKLLVEPARELTDPARRRRAQLLSLLLLVLTVAMVMGVGARYVVRGELGIDMVLAVPVLALAYGLSRTPRVEAAAGLGLIALTFPSFIVAYQQAAHDPELARHALIWLALPLFFSSFVLSVRGTVTVSMLLVLAFVGFMLTAPTSAMPHFMMALSVIFVTAGLAVGAAVVHERDQGRIREELARRQRMEDQIRGAKDELEVRVAERTSELQQANERLGALVQSSPAAVIILDDQGKVTLWNPAAERIFGWTEAEVLGRPPQLVDDETADHAPWPTDLAKDTEPIDERMHARTKNGETLEVSVSAAPLRAEDSAVVGQMAVLIDVTERRRLEEQLRHSQKMEAIGQLAGGVAHDFNNLLTVITGNAEVALLDLEEDHPVREDLEAVQEAADRAAALTRQLLAFGRRQVLQPRSVDLNDVLGQLGSMLRRLIREDVSLESKPGEDLGPVRADPGQIEQVILNLAVNASDAMPNGGTLRIETANTTRRSSPNLRVEDDPPRDHVMLAISDTGEGMSSQVQERLFEPFFTTKELGHGTGLGLATVYGIVTQSDGQIEVESQVGEGSTFRVYFPRLEEEEARSAVVDQTPPPTGSEAVLVVEDERAVRDLVARMLRRLGYSVLTAANGQEALKLYQDGQRVDLVLTDVVMPEMGGPECAERLKQLQRDLRIVYMSGHAATALDNQRALDPGVPLVHKPFSPVELATQVRRALDGRSPTA